MEKSKFKIGEVIRHSLFSPQKVERIENGKYHLRFLGGRKMLFVHEIEAIDRYSHRKEEWDKIYGEKFTFEKDVSGDFLDCTENFNLGDK